MVVTFKVPPCNFNIYTIPHIAHSIKFYLFMVYLLYSINIGTVEPEPDPVLSCFGTVEPVPEFSGSGNMPNSQCMGQKIAAALQWLTKDVLFVGYK